ncbi:hypothetical protein EVAR_23608_1 [Eumeta japonica]|uniref:Uncharacterized protein n=1 Tax=Eumeta variegata TaxID=151549 RepID=A0A4C1WXI1_EUMVA|nr:hypothetical protein EVAR_23608_1 [Eumeta japonica]
MQPHQIWENKFTPVVESKFCLIRWMTECQGDPQKIQNHRRSGSGRTAWPKSVISETKPKQSQTGTITAEEEGLIDVHEPEVAGGMASYGIRTWALHNLQANQAQQS